MDFVQPEVSVGELVGLINDTLDYAYPAITVTGELANLRVSKNRWVYFDLKDELASVKFFGTVYMLPGPLEDGMLLKVRATPRLHNLYGFSMNVQSMQPAGEGSIRKAAELLQAKLQKEGLFDPARKRSLPYPPKRIGLVASKQSAAYADFIKIINARWSGLDITFFDVQVQGEPAPAQITTAIERCNEMAEPPEVVVVIRGGGSPEDLAAFSTEQVTRAVAASRVPTLVAIGHEIDLSLAELAADQRASTPSNAAELLVPDKQQQLQALMAARERLGHLLQQSVVDRQTTLAHTYDRLQIACKQLLNDAHRHIELKKQLLEALDPSAALRRGYAVLRVNHKAIHSITKLHVGDDVAVSLADGEASAQITGIMKGIHGKTD